MADDGIQIVREQFWYNAVYNTIAAGATSTQAISIQADADFVVRKQTRDVRLSDGVTPYTTPSATVTIVDTGSNRQMSDIAVHIENCFGSAQFPYILPQEKRFSANCVVNVTMTSLETVTTMIARLCFHGYKEYKYRPPAR
jgi:hypothetical protein